jgi:hypothetical protein
MPSICREPREPGRYGALVTFHLAQVNVARPLAPIDDPRLAEFMALLDPVNALADESPGFVWRLQDESGNATAFRLAGDDESDDRIMVNMSVWTSIDLLSEFVYDSMHVQAMRRRREWFEHFGAPYQAMWWVPSGTLPTLEDAKERLDHLAEHGPTPHAFTFKQRFMPGGAEVRAEPVG